MMSPLGLPIRLGVPLSQTSVRYTNRKFNWLGPAFIGPKVYRYRLVSTGIDWDVSD